MCWNCENVIFENGTYPTLVIADRQYCIFNRHKYITFPHWISQFHINAKLVQLQPISMHKYGWNDSDNETGRVKILNHLHSTVNCGRYIVLPKPTYTCMLLMVVSKEQQTIELLICISYIYIYIIEHTGTVNTGKDVIICVQICKWSSAKKTHSAQRSEVC